MRGYGRGAQHAAARVRKLQVCAGKASLLGAEAPAAFSSSTSALRGRQRAGQRPGPAPRRPRVPWKAPPAGRRCPSAGGLPRSRR